jgi:DNA-binding IclR family transcriptional regulator
MTKNMVYRALRTLVEQGYLVRNEARQTFELGFRVLELQNAFSPDPSFRTLCGPYVEKIHELTGETVSVVVPAGDQFVFIDGIETRQAGVWRLQIGRVRPLHVAASGRLMLAMADDAFVERYISAHTPMDMPAGPLRPDVLRREIAAIRKNGYATVITPGSLPMAVAAFPVFDCDGGLHGVIAVGGPQERFGHRLTTLMPTLCALVEELSGRTRLYSANNAGSYIG